MRRTQTIKILLFLVSIVFWGCSEEISKDVSDNQDLTPSLTIEKAKEWYEANFLSSASEGLFKVKTNDSTVFALKPLLNWDIAQLDNDSLWSVVELPWEYENGKVTMTLPEVKSYVENNNVDFKPILRLVILKNKQTGETYGFKMAVIPELNYMLSKGGDVSSNDYFDRDANFSGLIMYYSVDDKFVNGWQYSKGKITGALKQTNPKANSKAQRATNMLDLVQMETCGFYYSEYGGTRSYGVDCYSTFYYALNPIEFNTEYSFPGNYDTSYNSGGGATPTTPTTPTTKNTALLTTNTPCANLWAMTNDPDFVKAIADLNSSTSKNYEIIKTFKINSNGDYIFASQAGALNTPEVNIDVTGTIDALLHSHYDGILRIFSPADLIDMYNKYTNGHMNNTSTFQSVLVTSDGIYSLSINDLEKFKSFGDGLVHDPGFNMNGINTYYRLYITGKTSSEAVEKFTHLLNDDKTGLSLMITNQKFDSIVNKTVDANNTVQSISCK